MKFRNYEMQKVYKNSSHLNTYIIRQHIIELKSNFLYKTRYVHLKFRVWQSRVKMLDLCQS